MHLLSNQVLKFFIIIILVHCGSKTTAQTDKAEKLNTSAIAFFQKKEYANAIIDFSEAIRIDLGYAKAWSGRGNVYQALKKYDEAIKDFTEAILLEKSAQSFNSRAKMYELTKQNELALADYVQAINADPKYKATYTNRINFYRKLGMYESALEYATDFIDKNPSLANAYYWRGRVYEESRKYLEAIPDYSTAIRLDPNDFNSIQQLGVCYKLRGEYSLAIEQFERIISMYPKWGLGYLNLMSPLMRSRRFLKAKDYLEQFKKLDTEEFNSFLEQGAEYKYITRALLQDMPLNNYESALQKMNNASDDFNRRVKNITSAIKGNDLEIYIDILSFKAYLLEKLNRNTEAVDNYKQALVIYKNQPEVKEGIVALEKKLEDVAQTDKTSPIIEIIIPQSSRGLIIVENNVKTRVIGRAKDDGGIASITVNGITVNKIEDDGLFISDIILKPGENSLLIDATDKQGNKANLIYIINANSGTIKTDQEKIVPVENGKIPNYYAIMIAEKDYTDISIPDLINPVKDAKDLKNILENEYTFRSENIDTLYNRTRDEIMYAIVQKCNSLTENDNLVIFYAGHGIAEKDKFGDVDGYWIPTSAKKGLLSSYISAGDINIAIKRSKAKHILVIADACFSGAFTRSLPGASVGIQKQFEVASRKVMASGNLEPVPDNSKFLYYLKKTLESNKEKYISAKKVFDSFYDAIINNTENLPQYAAIKNVGDEGGEFVFIKK